MLLRLILIPLVFVGQNYNYLLKNKIQTQIHYIPLHLQPAYKTVAFSSLKGTMNYYKDIVSLPLYPSMSKNDVKYITSKIIRS